MDELKITSSKKSLSETYTLRFDSFSGWAVIVIDERGFFFCQSDWGEFSHRWGAYTSNQSQNQDIKLFKSFLAEVDTHYFLGKTYHGPDRFFEDETKVQVAKEILRVRRENRVDRYTAREAYNYLASVDLFNQHSAVHILMENDALYKEVYESDALALSEDMVVDWPHSARFFGEKVLPVFQDLLRQELANG